MTTISAITAQLARLTEQVVALEQRLDAMESPPVMDGEAIRELARLTLARDWPAVRAWKKRHREPNESSHRKRLTQSLRPESEAP